MEWFPIFAALLAAVVIGYAIGYEMGAKSQRRFITMLKDENAHLKLTLNANKIRLYETQQQRGKSHECQSSQSKHYKH